MASAECGADQATAAGEGAAVGAHATATASSASAAEDDYSPPQRPTAAPRLGLGVGEVDPTHGAAVRALRPNPRGECVKALPPSPDLCWLPYPCPDPSVMWK